MGLPVTTAPVSVPPATSTAPMGVPEPSSPTSHPASVSARPYPPPPPRSRSFTYEEVLEATDGLNVRLGGGGFGEVYRGRLRRCGTPVAVKVLTQDPALGAAAIQLSEEQLLAEVRVLYEVQHPNVVPLRGAVLEGPQRCLVYDFMEGGNLEERLARANGRRALSATERVVILSDVARGLAHLHARRPRIIHRDMKTANVLLDRGLVGRIGDFGLARNMTGDADLGGRTTVTHVHTERLLGTLIYMSPEYKNGRLSTKVDAFAFGLVILEALTGLPVNGQDGNLLQLFEEQLEEDPAQLVQRLDPHAPGGWHGRIQARFLLHTTCLVKRWPPVGVCPTLASVHSCCEPQTDPGV